MKQGFEELGSLMQCDDLDYPGINRLSKLICDASGRDLETYQDQWVHYMKGFPHHFVRPLASVSHIDELERLIEMAPLLFSLDLVYEAIQ